MPHEGVTRFWLQYWQCATSEVHKWSEAFVDLEIQGAGEAVDQIRAQNQAVLPPDMEVVRTTKSASIRVKVPRVDRFGDFTPQREAVEAGLAAAVRLLALSSKIKGEVAE